MLYPQWRCLLSRRHRLRPVRVPSRRLPCSRAPAAPQQNGTSKERLGAQAAPAAPQQNATSKERLGLPRLDKDLAASSILRF